MKKGTTKAKRQLSKSPRTKRDDAPADYVDVLADMKQLIADSRHRALATVNRELVCLYWQIGYVIVQQQEEANWGDAIVEQLATDLRAAFPDMKGLSRDNLWRMRQFFLSVRDVDGWCQENLSTTDADRSAEKLGTLSRDSKTNTADPILGTLSRELASAALIQLVPSQSWSHHTEIMSIRDRPDERYFYMAMSARERWSVRELRRQIDSGLYLRYMSVRRDPEKCLPADAEQADLLPFKDHYILEFLGLSDEYSERELRKAILANLRDFFLEFGRDLTFVGEEFAITVGNDTFYIDLLFFQQTHSPRPGTPGRGAGGEGHPQCPLAIGLKIGQFKPEDVGKFHPVRYWACAGQTRRMVGVRSSGELFTKRLSHGVQFYCAALDEQVKLAYQNPSIGLVLCKTADSAQVRLALTAAARKIGVATYQTALPDEKLIRQRLEQLPAPTEETQG